MNKNKIIPKNNSFNQNSSSIQEQSINGKSPTKKQKNIPAEIWAKRNILKKLTLQLKFNKNQTQQYKKIRTELQHSFQEKKLKNEKKIAEKEKQKSNETLSPSNQMNVIKLTNAKLEDSMKYIDPFFPNTGFPMNGLKSYHLKSLSFQGNNFINVSKAIISQKSPIQKNSKPFSHRKLSLSNRQKDDENISRKKHLRTCSAAQNIVSHDPHIGKINSQGFLKISTKKLHLNTYENDPFSDHREENKILFKRTKTQTINDFYFTFQKRKLSLDEMKLTQKRPRSCNIKAKKTIDFSTCEAWNTKNSARQSEQNFPVYFRV